MEKLTPAQKTALAKLSKEHWQTSFKLKCSLATLNALVRKGYAESKGYGLFLPRHSIFFRAKYD